MFNLDACKLNSRRAAAFGAFAIGAIAFSASATATPLPQRSTGRTGGQCVSSNSSVVGLGACRRQSPPAG